MKRSKSERRNEAIERHHASTYDNSKAKRNGVTEDAWNKAKAEHIAHLETLRYNA